MNTKTFCFLLDKSSQGFVDPRNQKSLEDIISRYSFFKHGSFRDILFFSDLFTNFFIQQIQNKKELYVFFERASRKQEYVVSMSPGYRNIKAAINVMVDLSLPRINVFLHHKGLVPIVKVKLPRLVDKHKNYAELDLLERQAASGRTDHILLGREFYDAADKKVNLLYIDDIHLTGTSSNRTILHAQHNGAASVMGIYLLFVCSELALSEPSIENQINQKEVTCLLDKTMEAILNQEYHIPILRSLDILLRSQNAHMLPEFLSRISQENIIKSYLSYIGNEINIDMDYQLSLQIIERYLRERNLFSDVY